MSVVTEHKVGLGKFDRQGFDDFLAKRIDPIWLADARKAAYAEFETMGWPNPRSENWMRSDLRGFRIEKYSIAHETETHSTLDAPVHLLEGVEIAGSVRSANGIVIAEELEESLKAKGVLFGSLSRLSREKPELVKKYLHTLIDQSADRFAALQVAMWSDGYLLYVPRNVIIEKPLHIHASMTDGGSDLSHTLVVLEEGAEATVLTECSSATEQGSGMFCGGVELILGARSNLRYVSLQDWGQKVWHFAHKRASVGQDATLQWTLAAMGSRFAQVDQQVEMVAPGARSFVNGVMFTRDRQHLTYNTIQRHCAPHCTSDFLYKSVLQDRSRTVWRGMIKVDEGADKTDGYQRNDNLMLSDTARADSIPGLEIKADDVRCTHGSTSGRVDEELIFYARSRGFTRQEAILMIVTGFFQQIFDRITIESVREALGKAIARQVRQYE
ncbi:MAG: Fe-S cluster assembly protein SufD [Pirellula sp.]